MPTRAEHRDTTESAIIAAGQRLLAEGGADALTIRGVARELDLVPSALYRYVTKREDLLDLLVQHAHADLAASIQAAHDAVPRADWPAAGVPSPTRCATGPWPTGTSGS